MAVLQRFPRLSIAHDGDGSEFTHPTMPPKLRAVVNAVTFARALSTRKGRNGVVRTAVGIRNAGIQKATNNTGASAARPTATQHLARLDDRKEPEAVTEIPEKWGGVEKLLEHWIGPAGVVYLVKCQKKVEWATEWALLQVTATACESNLDADSRRIACPPPEVHASSMLAMRWGSAQAPKRTKPNHPQQRHDGRVALSFYREVLTTITPHHPHTRTSHTKISQGSRAASKFSQHSFFAGPPTRTSAALPSPHLHC